MKGAYVHIKNTRVKQLCNHKLRDFAMAVRVRKLFGPSRNGTQVTEQTAVKWSTKYKHTISIRPPNNSEVKMVT